MSESSEPKGQKKDPGFMKALRLVVHRAGGAKRVAAVLWPKIKLVTAHQRVLGCLDLRRREHFSPEELIFLMRIGKEVADHSAMESFATLSGYSKPYPIATEDERVDLQRRYLKATEDQQAALAKFEEFERKWKKDH